MAVTITDVLNKWDQVGIFKYVLPFLLIFALVFALLQKTRIFARAKGGTPKDHPDYEHNATIEVIIAAAIGLLALQLNSVSMFFANIFPKFGIGLAIFLVLLIFLGFFYQPDERGKWPGKVTAIGWVIGIGVVIWALSNWGTWFSGGFTFGLWLDEYFWALVVLAIVVGVIWAIKKGAERGQTTTV